MYHTHVNKKTNRPYISLGQIPKKIDVELFDLLPHRYPADAQDLCRFTAVAAALPQGLEQGRNCQPDYPGRNGHTYLK